MDSSKWSNGRKHRAVTPSPAVLSIALPFIFYGRMSLLPGFAYLMFSSPPFSIFIFLRLTCSLPLAGCRGNVRSVRVPNGTVVPSLPLLRSSRHSTFISMMRRTFRAPIFLSRKGARNKAAATFETNSEENPKAGNAAKIEGPANSPELNREIIGTDTLPAHWLLGWFDMILPAVSSTRRAFFFNGARFLPCTASDFHRNAFPDRGLTDNRSERRGSDVRSEQARSGPSEAGSGTAAA